MRFTEDELKTFEIRNGDLLVCEGGEPGRCAVWNNGPTALKYQKALLRVRFPNEIAPSLVALYIRSLANSGLLQDHFTGTTFKHLPHAAFEKIRITVPPQEEQRRLVAKLDSLRARSTRATQELDRIPKLIERYKQAILAKAFSGELTAEWRMHGVARRPIEPRDIDHGRSQIDEESNFQPPYDLPHNWHWLRLPDLGDLDRGRSRHRPRNDPRLFGGDYPFVQTGDVRAADRYLIDYTQTYSDFGLAQSRLWPVGTVCITIAANIAETAILAREACFPDSVVGFIADSNRTSSEYVEFFFRTIRVDLERFASATAQKNINLETLYRVRVPSPPLDEQREIVRRLEIALGWLSKVAAEHDRAAHLLPRLDQAILAKAFRGELVPQDPRDEPASALLEHIKASRATVTRERRRGRRKKT
jgi:type I restriction enzyme S subunit